MFRLLIQVLLSLHSLQVLMSVYCVWLHWLPIISTFVRIHSTNYQLIEKEKNFASVTMTHPEEYRLQSFRNIKQSSQRRPWRWIFGLQVKNNVILLHLVLRPHFVESLLTWEVGYLDWFLSSCCWPWSIIYLTDGPSKANLWRCFSLMDSSENSKISQQVKVDAMST